MPRQEVENSDTGNKGMIVTIIVVVVGIILLGAGGFGAYRFKELKKENVELAQKVYEEVENDELEELKKQIEELQNKENGTPKVAQESPQDDKEVEVVREVVYVPQTPTVSESDRKAEIDLAVEKALADIQNDEIDDETENTGVVIESEEDYEPISIVTTRQTAYPDEYGGVYGSFELEIEVAPKGTDIYIPMTTSNSIGAGRIGFSYSIEGDSFSGIQNSKVSYCTLTRDNFCKIKDGQKKKVVVTVWLTPDVDGGGNYSVKFNRIRYLSDIVSDFENVFVVDKETDRINLFY